MHVAVAATLEVLEEVEVVCVEDVDELLLSGELLLEDELLLEELLVVVVPMFGGHNVRNSLPVYVLGWCHIALFSLTCRCASRCA